MIDTICPISTLNQQLTNLEQTHIRCSLHSERWCRRRGLRASFAFFQSIYLADGRVNEAAPTVEELSDLRKPGAMGESPPFVMNCNCVQVWLLVSLNWFLLIAGAIFVVNFFSKNQFFVPFLWWLWMRSKSSSTTSMKGNTPLALRQPKPQRILVPLLEFTPA